MPSPQSKAVLACVCRPEPAHKAWRRALAWAELAGHTPVQQHKAARMGFITGAGKKPCQKSQKSSVTASTGCHTTVRTAADVIPNGNVWRFSSGKLPDLASMCNVCKRQQRGRSFWTWPWTYCNHLLLLTATLSYFQKDQSLLLTTLIRPKCIN